MVYVHSKLMIVDDEYLIVGSANLNERLAGNRDTEICVYMQADQGKAKAAQDKIKELRKKAWSEHFSGFGGQPPPSWDSPEMTACSGAMRSKGIKNWVAFATGAPPDGSHLIAWPFEVSSTGTGFYVAATTNSGWMRPQETYVFDAAADSAGSVNIDWMWASPNGGSFAIPGSWAE